MTTTILNDQSAAVEAKLFAATTLKGKVWERQISQDLQQITFSDRV